MAYVNEYGYRQPDRGQENIPQCRTCADFYYEDWKAAIYIDGPHHEDAAQREKDKFINRALGDVGFYVVRFPKDKREWPKIFPRACRFIWRPHSQRPASSFEQAFPRLDEKTSVRLRLELQFEGNTPEARNRIKKIVLEATGALPDEVEIEGLFEGSIVALIVMYVLDAITLLRTVESPPTGPLGLVFVGASLSCSGNLEGALEHHPKKAGIGVVCVHGLMGGENSFGKLPDFLYQSLPDTATYKYLYPSSLGTDPSLYEIALNLGRHILLNANHERLVLIAHSLGGLVVRRLLTGTPKAFDLK